MISLKNKYLKGVAALAPLLLMVPAQADIVQNDDVIITFSACVGNDCVNGESFGFDTLRLKENNLRLHFDDTSVSASFPSNDWRLVVNDSSNGGDNYFAIEDSTAGRQPFRVDAGAPANALRVDSAGDVGLGTSNPVVDLHMVSGNTPTVRLAQDGSSGFTAQTFDMAANEANFFIRDVTNGSELVFRIQPGADQDSLFIENTNDIGMGTSAPSSSLHVRRTDGTAQVLVDNVGASSGTQLLRLQSDRNPQIDMFNTNTNRNWRFNPGNAFILRRSEAGPNGAHTEHMRITTGGRVDFSGGPGAETNFRLEENGDLMIRGTLTSSVSVFPDYVFEKDYDLLSLEEVESFIKANGHLPRVPSASEVVENGLNMTEMQIKLFEKVEELTLYVIEQNKTIAQLSEKLAEFESK